jgi:tetratricopeptide (TPR) repeat protein
VKKPQWITIGAAIMLTAGIFLFARTIPKKSAVAKNTTAEQHSEGDGHDHGAGAEVTADTILVLAKKQLNPEQLVRINTLENSISRGDVKNQQLLIYRQLGRFWLDSVGFFEPYAWYQAEASRLENSEKSLTFAAHLFLDNLQNDDVARRRKWKALQAKDLFERSLKINPDNDSAKTGLGACYLFGGISDMPMEGIQKIREVVDKDSTNVYAQMMLAKGSLISGQYDKAISRLQIINRLQANNLDAVLLLADAFERTGDKANALSWYNKCLPLLNQQPSLKKEVEKRIGELKR